MFSSKRVALDQIGFRYKSLLLECTLEPSKSYDMTLFKYSWLF